MDALPFKAVLLFAVPTTRKAFLAAARSNPPSDYLRGVLGGSSPEHAWQADNGYHRVAAAGTRLAEQAIALGAHVVHQACSADLHHATATSDVVILCGHWRGEQVSSADLHGSPGEILTALKGSTGPVGDILRKAVALHPAPEPQEECVRAWRRDVTRTLNGLIASRAFDNVLGVSDPRESEAIGNALSRALIDEVLGLLIAPGNRLEMADGLLNEAQINASIAPDFSGELDLSVCKSVFLARFLGACRAEQAQRPIFHHGHNLLLPSTRFDVLGDVLNLCAQARMPFHAARAQIEAALVAAFMDSVSNKGNSWWACLQSWIVTTRRALSSGPITKTPS